jgi:UDP-N-acetylmuramyl pentapeptide phosphotransferase/UDP-N-acetylglucosamine-1-phosphate transferase
MEAFWIAFLVSALSSALVVRTIALHARFTADGHSGPQKRHQGAVPRVGGIGLMVGLLCGVLALSENAGTGTGTDTPWALLLLAAALPAFGSGLAEDLTKRVSPRVRLACALLAAALGIWLLDARIYSAGLAGVDTLLSFAPFAIGLTLIAVAGVCNAVNIVDGFNGLASGCVLLMLAAIAWVAFAVGDTGLGRVAVVAAGAVLGFMVWNYPHGRIFLGDGGAYLLGFVVVQLALLLVLRNPRVSPLLPLLVCAYPVMETLFTMARRVRGGWACAFLPDGLHLHSLIYRRLTRGGFATGHSRSAARRNARTSPYLWLLCALSLLPCVLAWDNTLALVGMALMFVGVYLGMYRAIVRFRTPRWARLRALPARAEMAVASAGVQDTDTRAAA